VRAVLDLSTFASRFERDISYIFESCPRRLTGHKRTLRLTHSPAIGSFMAEGTVCMNLGRNLLIEDYRGGCMNRAVNGKGSWSDRRGGIYRYVCVTSSRPSRSCVQDKKIWSRRGMQVSAGVEWLAKRGPITPLYHLAQDGSRQQGMVKMLLGTQDSEDRAGASRNSSRGGRL
jgi:hypothetical protein